MIVKCMISFIYYAIVFSHLHVMSSLLLEVAKSGTLDKIYAIFGFSSRALKKQDYKYRTHGHWSVSPSVSQAKSLYDLLAKCSILQGVGHMQTLEYWPVFQKLSILQHSCFETAWKHKTYCFMYARLSVFSSCFFFLPSALYASWSGSQGNVVWGLSVSRTGNWSVLLSVYMSADFSSSQ